MSSTALTVIDQPDVTHSYEAMRRHLSVKHMDAPREIAEEPSIAAQLALASMHLAFAVTFYADATRRALLRLSRPGPLIGLTCGVYAILLTALSVWR